MRKEQPKQEFTPETVWKTRNRFAVSIWIINVYENERNIVDWIGIASYSDIEAVTIALSMLYAGLAVVKSVVYDGDDPEGHHLYTVELDAGAS